MTYDPNDPQYQAYSDTKSAPRHPTARALTVMAYAFVAAIVVLGLLGTAPGLAATFPDAGHALGRAAVRLHDGSAYAQWVLSSAAPTSTAGPAPHWTTAGIGFGLLSAAGAVVVAAALLAWPWIRRRV